MKTLAECLMGSGAGVLFAAAIYHLCVRPEWTQAQALRQQWLPLMAGVVLFVTGFVLHVRIEETK